MRERDCARRSATIGPGLVVERDELVRTPRTSELRDVMRNQDRDGAVVPCLVRCRYHIQAGTLVFRYSKRRGYDFR